MSDPQVSTGFGGEESRTEVLSASFAQLVTQQANMATMLLGKVPHPETGEVFKDLEAARLFIDQLEMLEVKTRGNLTKEETGLLRQSLMSLRLAFVEAVETPSQAKGSQAASAPPASGQNQPTLEPTPPAAESEEHPKKFSKKY
jgi:hypothetical protein